MVASALGALAVTVGALALVACSPGGYLATPTASAAAPVTPKPAVPTTPHTTTHAEQIAPLTRVGGTITGSAPAIPPHGLTVNDWNAVNMIAG
jgi:hypothetical protein